jgi:chromosome segregation ATPase
MTDNNGNNAEIQELRELIISMARLQANSQQTLNNLANRIDNLAERQVNTQDQIDNLALRQANSQDQIDSLALRQANSQDQIDNLALRQANTQDQLDMLVSTANSIFARNAILNDVVLELQESTERHQRIFETHLQNYEIYRIETRENLDEQHRTTNAALQSLEAILMQLIRNLPPNN